jgi:hypothetical protein
MTGAEFDSGKTKSKKALARAIPSSGKEEEGVRIISNGKIIKVS